MQFFPTKYANFLHLSRFGNQATIDNGIIVNNYYARDQKLHCSVIFNRFWILNGFGFVRLHHLALIIL